MHVVTAQGSCGSRDTMIASSETTQMDATISYIHANPVTEGLSPTPEAYLWSSANPKHGCDLEAFYHR